VAAICLLISDGAQPLALDVGAMNRKNKIG
jgi:hypothetical protein